MKIIFVLLSLMSNFYLIAGPRVLDDEYETSDWPVFRFLIIVGGLVYCAYKFASRPKEPNGESRDGRGCFAAFVTFFIMVYLFNTVFRSCVV